MTAKQTWWLSFVGPEGFRGVVLVDCAMLAEAHLIINARGVNPGGEIAGFSFSADDDRMDAADRKRMAALPRLTRLTRAQLEATGLDGQTFGEARQSGGFDVDAAEAGMEVICEDCNLKVQS